MFEPLNELLLAFQEDGGRTALSGSPVIGSAVLSDRRLLGEKDGRLFGSSEQAEYVTRGGAVYACRAFANNSVVGWSGASAGNGNGDDSGRDDDGGDSSRRAALQRRALRRGGPRRVLAHVAGGCLVLPRHLARVALCTAAYLLPALRIAFPAAVPRPALVGRGRRRWLLGATTTTTSPSHSSLPERVTAVAFHPYLMVFAMAIDEGGADGGARVVVYDPILDVIIAVLTHAFQRDVLSLAWKPWAKDVLAVGCRGGVLLWSVNGGPGSPDTASAALHSNGHTTTATAAAAKECISAQAAASAFALFYRCSPGLPVTTLAFCNGNGRYLACGSRWTARLHILDVSCGPQDKASLLCSLVPSVEGGCEQALFSDDDTFILSAVAGAPYLSFVRTGRFPFTSTTVATPGPVLKIARATGVGPNYFFLYTRGLEGVLLARVSAELGVQVVSLVSTAICRGVGGAVRCVAASKRRVWVGLETGHLLLCYYNLREGHFNLMPVGVAATNATLMADFPGCATGSLLAVVEGDGAVSFIPSYHI